MDNADKTMLACALIKQALFGESRQPIYIINQQQENPPLSALQKILVGGVTGIGSEEAHGAFKHKFQNSGALRHLPRIGGALAGFAGMKSIFDNQNRERQRSRSTIHYYR